MNDVTLRVIGTVRNGRTTLEDRDWGEVESMITLKPEFASALAGLEGYSHVLVVFFMHVDPRDRPLGREATLGRAQRAGRPRGAGKRVRHPTKTNPREPLDIPLGGPDRADRVRDMFGRIVPRYDLMNRLMTGAQDRRWRQITARAAQPEGARVLDLATGTADLAIELARQGARHVVAADYCAPMLDAARLKLSRDRITNVDLVLADACALPFPSQSFDAITSGFLLRNVVDLPRCLAEMRRVLRPGGRAASLELTPPAPNVLSSLIRLYCRFVVPKIGGLISGDPAAYRYLPASVYPFPEANRLTEMFHDAGFASVTYRRFGLGTVAIHVATAPGNR